MIMFSMYVGQTRTEDDRYNNNNNNNLFIFSWFLQ